MTHKKIFFSHVRFYFKTEKSQGLILINFQLNLSHLSFDGGAPETYSSLGASFQLRMREQSDTHGRGAVGVVAGANFQQRG